MYLDINWYWFEVGSYKIVYFKKLMSPAIKMIGDKQEIDWNLGRMLKQTLFYNVNSLEIYSYALYKMKVFIWNVQLYDVKLITCLNELL